MNTSSPNKQKRRIKDVMKCKLGHFEFVKKKKKKKDVVLDSTSEELSSDNNNVLEKCIVLDSGSENEEEQHQIVNKTINSSTTPITTPIKRKMKAVDENLRNKENLESYSRNMNDIFEEFSSSRTKDDSNQEFLRNNVINISDEEHSEQTIEHSRTPSSEKSFDSQRQKSNLANKKTIEKCIDTIKERNIDVCPNKSILSQVGTSKLNTVSEKGRKRDVNETNMVISKSADIIEPDILVLDKDKNSSEANKARPVLEKEQKVKRYKKKSKTKSSKKLKSHKRRKKKGHVFYKPNRGCNDERYFLLGFGDSWEAKDRLLGVAEEQDGENNDENENCSEDVDDDETNSYQEQQENELPPNTEKKKKKIIEKCYLCNICKKSFTTELLVKQHTVKKHLFNLNPHYKSKPPKQRTLDEEKPFICKLCGKRFRFRLGLKKHETATHYSPLNNDDDKDNHNEPESESSGGTAGTAVDKNDLEDIDLVIERNSQPTDASQYVGDEEHFDRNVVLKIKSENDICNSNNHVNGNSLTPSCIEIIDSDSEPDGTDNETSTNENQSKENTSLLKLSTKSILDSKTIETSPGNKSNSNLADISIKSGSFTQTKLNSYFSDDCRKTDRDSQNEKSSKSDESRVTSETVTSNHPKSKLPAVSEPLEISTFSIGPSYVSPEKSLSSSMDDSINKPSSKLPTVSKTLENMKSSKQHSYFSPNKSLNKSSLEQSPVAKTSPRSGLSLKLQKSKCAVYYVDNTPPNGPQRSPQKEMSCKDDLTEKGNKKTLNKSTESITNSFLVISPNSLAQLDQNTPIPVQKNHQILPSMVEQNRPILSNLKSPNRQILPKSVTQNNVYSNSVYQDHLTSPNSIKENNQVTMVYSPSTPQPVTSPIYIMDSTGTFLECPHCSERFTSLEELKHHDKKFHFLIACDICGVLNKGKHRLKQHYIKHTKDKSYFCGLCSKAFKTKGHLKTHLSIHSNEFPHLCDQCGRGFRRKNELKIHYDSEHNGLVYMCKKCGKGFKTKYILKYHMAKCFHGVNRDDGESISNGLFDEPVHNSLRRSGTTEDNSSKVNELLNRYKDHLHDPNEKTPFV